MNIQCQNEQEADHFYIVYIEKMMPNNHVQCDNCWIPDTIKHVLTKQGFSGFSQCNSNL